MSLNFNKKIFHKIIKKWFFTVKFITQLIFYLQESNLPQKEEYLMQFLASLR